jgi:predicted MFS family arabinose efflux permease
MPSLRSPAEPSVDTLGARTLVRLLILACATFISVTFEFLPVGLISEIAHDVHVSQSHVGLLVSGYAVVAALTTIPFVALLSRIQRGTVLIGSLLTLIVAEILTFLATSYPVMGLSRIIAALTHGVLWSLIAPAAASLVPPRKVGAATAIVFSGISMAAIVGSPGATLIGKTIGWRETAVLLAVATTVITIGVAWALDVFPHGRRANATRGITALTQGVSMPSRPVRVPAGWSAVLTLCLLAVILVIAHFTSYTYIVPIIERVSRSSGAVVGLLTLFGLAGAIGTLLTGRFNDGSPHLTAVVTLSVFLTGCLLLSAGFINTLPIGLRYALVTIAIVSWGGAYAAIGPVFQSGIIRAAIDDQDRASSLYVTGYQIGIASGSGLGAAVLSRSIDWLPCITALLTAAVLGAVLTRRVSRVFR